MIHQRFSVVAAGQSQSWTCAGTTNSGTAVSAVRTCLVRAGRPHYRDVAIAVVVAALILAAAGLAWAGAESESDARAVRRTAVVDVFESCRDAVVNISSTQIVEVRDPFDSFFQGFFDFPDPRGPRTRKYTSVGSGFVIHPDGYIVTNAHVVNRTNERKAIFPDGREIDAELIALDVNRDMAVLKIKADRPLPTLKLGRSDDLMIGETVIAIGNPLGYQHTVTAGVVSATERDLEFGNRPGLTGLIQTDASINPGNSGGPLLNVLGELIGVNTAIRGDAQNIGFAIPVNQLREILPEMLDVERRYRLIVGMKVDGGVSATVRSVEPGSPAENSGIRTGDVVQQIDGHQLRDGLDYAFAMIGRQAGQRVSMRLTRDGQAYSTSVDLIGRPKPDPARLAAERFGLVLRELSGRKGLEIIEVQEGSPLAGSGVKTGDLLVAVGRWGDLSMELLGEMLENINSGQRVPITIRREEGQRRFFQQTLQIQVR